MKKLILAAFALTTAASVFAQGTIYLTDRVTGTGGQTVHVYAPLSPTDTTAVVGKAANDTPAGATAFGARALIGASGLNTQYGASTTRAVYLAAVGAGVPEASLLPVGQTTTFRTGTGAGFLSEITSTLPAASGFGEAAVGPFTFTIAAWDNFSGLYSTWALAEPAWKAGLIAAGKMTPFTVNSLGGGTTPAVYPTQAGQNMTSFNLYFIPEPSSMALAGLGAAALLIFRRRK